MTDDMSAFATRTRYGTAHPEWVENDLWEQAIHEGWSGYALREHLGIELGSGRFRHDFSHSSYRDTTPGPFWSWQRVGRTSTPLPDGRVIHLAGEHEDGYDPDFCIYNDVVVEYPGGRREFYLYPKDVFPPTDFRAAGAPRDHPDRLAGLSRPAPCGRNPSVETRHADPAHRARRDNRRSARLDIATHGREAWRDGHSRGRRQGRDGGRLPTEHARLRA